jgi:peptide/nickel transport system ATP-binding protein
MSGDSPLVHPDGLAPPQAADRRLLVVDDLTTRFSTDRGVATAVDGVSFHVDVGETLGLVGESGCGKSVTSLSLLRLITRPGRIDAASSVRFRDRELLELSEAEMRAARGNDIAMIFQEPMTSLNPVYPVGEQIAEALRLHRRLDRKEAWQRAVEMLGLVGIPSPGQRAHDYPHQLSGGQRQRVMIAMALSCDPDLLIADEPTTALDVTIQAQILDLLAELRLRLGMAMILITHDLGVVADVCDRVAVMYAGQIVEEATTEEIFESPAHPYTRGLLEAIPRIDATRGTLAVIPGQVPSPTEWPAGCRFHPRCPFAWDLCANEAPPLIAVAPGHRSRCWLEKHPDRRSPQSNRPVSNRES